MKARFVEKIRRYYEAECSKCNKKYKSLNEKLAIKKALKCSRRITEKKVFKIGDRVTSSEMRYCQIFDQHYYMTGKVTGIKGPMISDYEYEVKWLGADLKRVNGHVYQYEVEFRCPRCKELRIAIYYTPLLKLIPRIPKEVEDYVAGLQKKRRG